jgi:hypothetical protein
MDDRAHLIEWQTSCRCLELGDELRDPLRGGVAWQSELVVDRKAHGVRLRLMDAFSKGAPYTQGESGPQPNARHQAQNIARPSCASIIGVTPPRPCFVSHD